jgi:hypothetical protein
MRLRSGRKLWRDTPVMRFDLTPPRRVTPGAGSVPPDLELRRLAGVLQPLEVKRMPLDEPPPRKTRFGTPLELSRVHWVRPERFGIAADSKACIAGGAQTLGAPLSALHRQLRSPDRHCLGEQVSSVGRQPRACSDA